jgi:predicted transposase YbfD/YdcC
VQKLRCQKPEWTGEIQSAHGRIDQRHLRRIDLDEEISSFPQARQLISMTRVWECKKTGVLKAESRLFITSLESQEMSPAQLARIIRGHWAIENKNHWRRDTTRWREDHAPRRHPRGAKNLALLRGALLALIPLEKFDSLNAALDHYACHSGEALALIRSADPFPT